MTLQVLSEHAAETILSEIQRLDDLAYEQYIEGELTESEFRTVCNSLREWVRLWNYLTDALLRN